MESTFYRVLLNDRVKVEPRFISKSFRNYIVQKLKKTMEGVCTKHGYIKENSIELYKVAPGFVDLVGLNGTMVFNVYYYADVCNPLIGNVLKAVVTNVNKFGILAECGNIIEIIVAKNSVNIVHDTQIDLDKIKISDNIMVEVVGKKFELNDKKISVIGKIVLNPIGKTTHAKKKEEKDTKDLDDDNGDVDNADDAIADVDGNTSMKGGESDDEDAEVGDDEDEKEGGGCNEFFASDDDDFAEDEYDFYSEEEFGDGDVDADADADGEVEYD